MIMTITARIIPTAIPAFAASLIPSEDDFSEPLPGRRSVGDIVDVGLTDFLVVFVVDFVVVGSVGLVPMKRI